MTVRHSVIAYSEDLGTPQTVSFAGDAWREYVPIRMPDIICIEERLPAGAAVVLINQSHTYRDLFLPIDPVEKHLFDSIDGSCTIGEILHNTLPPSRSEVEAARSFFERLWWYDQIVVTN
ncbi:MAG: hypothetical protein WCE73_01190 [Candidatus Angelobacter sp.]